VGRGIQRGFGNTLALGFDAEVSPSFFEKVFERSALLRKLGVQISSDTRYRFL
jgi:hypothetical protein